MGTQIASLSSQTSLYNFRTHYNVFSEYCAWITNEPIPNSDVQAIILCEYLFERCLKSLLFTTLHASRFICYKLLCQERTNEAAHEG